MWTSSHSNLWRDLNAYNIYVLFPFSCEQEHAWNFVRYVFESSVKWIVDCCLWCDIHLTISHPHSASGQWIDNEFGLLCAKCSVRSMESRWPQKVAGIHFHCVFLLCLAYFTCYAWRQKLKHFIIWRRKKHAVRTSHGRHDHKLISTDIRINVFSHMLYAQATIFATIIEFLHWYFLRSALARSWCARMSCWLAADTRQVQTKNRIISGWKSKHVFHSRRDL